MEGRGWGGGGESRGERVEGGEWRREGGGERVEGRGWWGEGGGERVEGRDWRGETGEGGVQCFSFFFVSLNSVSWTLQLCHMPLCILRSSY